MLQERKWRWFSSMLLLAALYAAPLTGREEIDDQSIADAIEDAYVVDGAVNVNKIDVTVNSGIAQLEGTANNRTATLTVTVDTWREYHAAEENAREGGADSVINKLEVE